MYPTSLNTEYTNLKGYPKIFWSNQALAVLTIVKLYVMDMIF